MREWLEVKDYMAGHATQGQCVDHDAPFFLRALPDAAQPDADSIGVAARCQFKT
jgi:hypothetical protein